MVVFRFPLITLAYAAGLLLAIKQVGDITPSGSVGQLFPMSFWFLVVWLMLFVVELLWYGLKWTTRLVRKLW